VNWHETWMSCQKRWVFAVNICHVVLCNRSSFFTLPFKYRASDRARMSAVKDCTKGRFYVAYVRRIFNLLFLTNSLFWAGDCDLGIPKIRANLRGSVLTRQIKPKLSLYDSLLSATFLEISADVTAREIKRGRLPNF
jgi:hypothetical protein